MYSQKKIDAPVSILTAGKTRHYSLGLASALIASGQKFDFIASDELESAELYQSPQVNFLNLRRDQSVDAPLVKKMLRVLAYYFRLLSYAATTRAKVFHIQWNNKWEWFDRTFLMVFYKLCGKKIAFTAHNINAAERDGSDSFFNRLTLKIQYRLCDRIFVHTGRMKNELMSIFNVSEQKIILIPHGWNNAVPNTALTRADARGKLSLQPDDKVILFFGNIASYKGLEYLLKAFETIAGSDSSAKLIIAGSPKGSKDYWREIQSLIANSGCRSRIIEKIEYISDADTEIYCKSADVLVLPYVHIFQSGVLFFAYSFGLPVIATDVGSFRDEIVEGRTGFVCAPKDSVALASAIDVYFKSDLYQKLELRRSEIQNFVKEKNSWNKVAAITTGVYADLLCERTKPHPVLKVETDDEAFGLNSHSSL
jgi:glycosyltransferase involved in cell wall biosynthesis